MRPKDLKAGQVTGTACQHANRYMAKVCWDPWGKSPTGEWTCSTGVGDGGPPPCPGAWKIFSLLEYFSLKTSRDTFWKYKLLVYGLLVYLSRHCISGHTYSAQRDKPINPKIINQKFFDFKNDWRLTLPRIFQFWTSYSVPKTVNVWIMK